MRREEGNVRLIAIFKEWFLLNCWHLENWFVLNCVPA